MNVRADYVVQRDVSVLNTNRPRFAEPNNTLQRSRNLQTLELDRRVNNIQDIIRVMNYSAVHRIHSYFQVDYCQVRDGERRVLAAYHAM